MNRIEEGGSICLALNRIFKYACQNLIGHVKSDRVCMEVLLLNILSRVIDGDLRRQAERANIIFQNM